MLIDTHCHLHDADFPLDQEQAYQQALAAGVGQMIVVGTDEASSKQALDFAADHDGVFASVGVHPHYAKDGLAFLSGVDFRHPKLVAIGEIGLDYHYNFSPQEIQKVVLQDQIKLALKHDLPIIFHVREAFVDFWEIVNQFEIPRAVVHSFSDNLENLNKILAKSWYVGVNGIATFTNDSAQIEAFKQIPLEKLLLETDAPYLAPKAHRGKVNQPAYVRSIGAFLSDQYQISLDDLAKITSDNARRLFNLP